MKHPQDDIPTVPCGPQQTLDELLEEVAIVSQRVPRAYAIAQVADNHAGGTEAFHHLVDELIRAQAKAESEEVAA